MSDDPDLRSQLERIASVVGDPPEHGLDRVAARRHRRLRRRRGAVATAAVLAVLATATALINRPTRERVSVTASESASPSGAPAELPAVVEVRCEPTGIDVPVASVRPERDGLYISVVNTLRSATVVEVEGPDDWSSGEIRVEPGRREVRQPVPPGALSIGCEIGGQMQRRRVDLVDPAGYYEPPELDCDSRVDVLHDLPVPRPGNNIIHAARGGLESVLAAGTEGAGIGAVRGYVSQRLGDETTDPVVQVTRDGDVIAFAHVRGEGGASDPPWTTIETAEVCSEERAAAAEPDTNDTTTTERPDTQELPP